MKRWMQTAIPQYLGELFNQKGGDASCPAVVQSEPGVATKPSGSNAVLTVPSAGTANNYPNSPGYKREGTSKDAAEEIKSEASALRQACLDCIAQSPKTSDEVAASLGRSVLAIRPRCSELKLLGKITETTERRKNASGKWASVWRVA